MVGVCRRWVTTKTRADGTAEMALRCGTAKAAFHRRPKTASHSLPKSFDPPALLGHPTSRSSSPAGIAVDTAGIFHLRPFHSVCLPLRRIASSLVSSRVERRRPAPSCTAAVSPKHPSPLPTRSAASRRLLTFNVRLRYHQAVQRLAVVINRSTIPSLVPYHSSNVMIESQRRGLLSALNSRYIYGKVVSASVCLGMAMERLCG